jgi:hypothetical protein
MKNGKSRHIIYLALFSIISISIYATIELLSIADIWVRISDGTRIVSIEINNEEILYSRDGRDADFFISCNPKHGLNKLKAKLSTVAESKEVIRECSFRKNSHRCSMTIYVSNENLVCSDCNHLR